MNIWLDDERDPSDPFIQSNYPSAGYETWIWMKTVEEVLPFILEGKVTAISFDNDLGEGNVQGYHLANRIEELAHAGKIPKIKWYVHTQNPIAYGKITQAMLNADKFWKKSV